MYALDLTYKRTFRQGGGGKERVESEQAEGQSVVIDAK